MNSFEVRTEAALTKKSLITLWALVGLKRSVELDVVFVMLFESKCFVAIGTLERPLLRMRPEVVCK